MAEELISRKQALKLLKQAYKECEQGFEKEGGEAGLIMVGLEDAIDIIKDLPTIAKLVTTEAAKGA